MKMKFKGRFGKVRFRLGVSHNCAYSQDPMRFLLWFSFSYELVQFLSDILTLSLPFFAIWLGSVNISPQLNSLLMTFINFIPIKLIFILWFFIFNHHLLNGFKYFLWSFALGMDIKNVYLATYIILTANIFMTIAFSWIIF